MTPESDEARTERSLTLVHSSPVQPAGKKACITCGRTLPVAQFYRLHKTGEARQSRCKRCDNAVRARGMVAHRELAGEPQAPIFKDPIDHFAEEADEPEDAPWTRERIARAAAWRTYQRECFEREGRRRHKDGDRIQGGDHVVDDEEIERWSNEVVGELRAGSELRLALKQANRDTSGLGQEDPPAGFQTPGALPRPLPPSADAQDTSRRAEAPESPAYRSRPVRPEKGDVMGFEEFVEKKREHEDIVMQACLAALEGGEKGITEIAEVTDYDAKVVQLAMRRARDAGLVDVNGWARGARWSKAEGAPAPKAPTKRARAQVKAKAPAKKVAKRTDRPALERKAKASPASPLSLEDALKAERVRIDIEIAHLEARKRRVEDLLVELEP